MIGVFHKKSGAKVVRLFFLTKYDLKKSGCKKGQVL
jgi:hypothetical protein